MSERPTPASSVAALAGAHTTSARTIATTPRTARTIPAALRAGAGRRSRGGRIRTGEPPRPKRGALTRLSYAPSPQVCTHRVAVGAHEVAFGDLIENSLPVVLA